MNTVQKICYVYFYPRRRFEHCDETVFTVVKYSFVNYKTL
jgi:hypothetical protein